MIYINYMIALAINCLGYLAIGLGGQLEFSWIIWFVYVGVQWLIYKAFFGVRV